MKSLESFLFSGLIAFGLGCSIQNQAEKDEIAEITIYQKGSGTEKEIILSDIYDAYTLAFPDTIKYRPMGTKPFYYTDFGEDSFWVSVVSFDSDSDKTADLVVFYRLKSFDILFKKPKIDSSKAPPIIFHMTNGRNLRKYHYNKGLHLYEKTFEVNDIKKPSLPSSKKQNGLRES